MVVTGIGIDSVVVVVSTVAICAVGPYDCADEVYSGAKQDGEGTLHAYETGKGRDSKSKARENKHQRDLTPHALYLYPHCGA